MSEDTSTLKEQIIFSTLHMLLYEYSKIMLTEKLKDFFSIELIDNCKPYQKVSSKYKNNCSRCGGVFEYGFEFYCLKSDQIDIIEKARKIRNICAHSFFDFFLTDQEFITKEYLYQFLDIVRYLDNYFIVEIDIPIAGTIVKDSELEKCQSVYFLLLEQVYNKLIT